MSTVATEENKVWSGVVEGFQCDVFRSDYTTDVYVRNGAHSFDLAAWRLSNQLQALGVDMVEWFYLTSFDIYEDKVMRFQNA